MKKTIWHTKREKNQQAKVITLDAELKTKMKICKLETDLLMVQHKLLNKSKDLKSSHQQIQHLKAQVKSLCSMKENLKPALY